MVVATYRKNGNDSVVLVKVGKTPVVDIFHGPRHDYSLKFKTLRCAKRYAASYALAWGLTKEERK